MRAIELWPTVVLTLAEAVAEAVTEVSQLWSLVLLVHSSDYHSEFTERTQTQ